MTNATSCGPLTLHARTARQQAVKQLAAVADTDLVLIAGSANSSNPLRPVEVARAVGAGQAHLIDHTEQILPAWLTGATTIGVSSGASVPDVLVHDVLAWLADHGYCDAQTLTYTKERKHFALSGELSQPAGGKPSDPAHGDEKW